MQGFYTKQRFWFIFKKDEGKKISRIKVEKDIVYAYDENDTESIISTFDYPIKQISVYTGISKVEDFTGEPVAVIRQSEVRNFAKSLDCIGTGFLVDVNTEAIYE